MLASVGFDHKIFVWNTSTGEQLCKIDGFHTDIIYSISWNYDGSLLATTCKDKKIRVIDPRKNEIISVSVYVALCVCVRERGRGREREYVDGLRWVV